jgi:hypothetical protein
VSVALESLDSIAVRKLYSSPVCDMAILLIQISFARKGFTVR